VIAWAMVCLWEYHGLIAGLVIGTVIGLIIGLAL
jgi:hypothetical protein